MSQSLSSILIHLVFSTKYREPLITPENEAELHAYMVGILRNCQSPSLLVGGMPDHIHALFWLHRTWSVADVAEEVKKSSSKWIKTKGATWRAFQWQAGYGAFSVSHSGVNKVKRYIAEQSVHHNRLTFQDEFRGLLRKHQVEYDERYVWD